MAGLTRQGIVEAAFELLEEGGLDAITARALGARLGVQAGALYYHLPDMAALRNEMATVIMRELSQHDPPQSGDGDWRAFLTGLAEHLRAVLLRHRDGAALFAGTRLTDDETIGSMEQPLRVLTSAGFDLDTAVRVVQTMTAFVTGFVIEEQHRAGAPDDYTPDRRGQRIDAGRFPLTAAANAAFLIPAETAFRQGVRIIVRGADPDR